MLCGRYPLHINGLIENIDEIVWATCLHKRLGPVVNCPWTSIVLLTIFFFYEYVYILLDVLFSSVAEDFYELSRPYFD